MSCILLLGITSHADVFQKYSWVIVKLFVAGMHTGRGGFQSELTVILANESDNVCQLERTEGRSS